jgi:hypothetical protein
MDLKSIIIIASITIFRKLKTAGSSRRSSVVCCLSSVVRPQHKTFDLFLSTKTNPVANVIPKKLLPISIALTLRP